VTKSPDDLNIRQGPNISQRTPNKKSSLKSNQKNKEEYSNLEFSPESSRFISQDEFNSKVLTLIESINTSPTPMNLEKLLALALKLRDLVILRLLSIHVNTKIYLITGQVKSPSKRGMIRSKRRQFGGKNTVWNWI